MRSWLIKPNPYKMFNKLAGAGQILLLQNIQDVCHGVCGKKHREINGLLWE
jgi:hypothetical protein